MIGQAISDYLDTVSDVYRAELLFRHQLDPLQLGCELRADQ